MCHLIGDEKGTKFRTDPWLFVGQLIDVYGAKVVFDLGLGDDISESRLIGNGDGI